MQQPVPVAAPLIQNFLKQPAKFFADMKTVELTDVIDQIPSLSDKVMPGKDSHVLERTNGDDCIVDNDGSILALGLVKPKIKPREATNYEDQLPDDWKYADKKLKCIQYVPAHKKCILVFASGQVLIISDGEDTYKVMKDSYDLRITPGFEINNISLVNDSHAVICCNKATIFSIKFSNSISKPTLIQAIVPELDQSASIYSVVNTNNPNDMNEHLFCTSVGLLIRNASGVKLGEPFVTNNRAQYQSIPHLDGKTVYQAVIIDKEESRFAVHYETEQVGIYDNVSKRILREFTFPTLLSIYSMQNVMQLPCILLRDQKSISIFNLDLNYRILVRQDIYYISEKRDLQIAYAGHNSKYPSSIQILYIEHIINEKKKERDSRLQTINIDSKKIQQALSVRDK